MMAMLLSTVASKTEIIVFTAQASDKVFLSHFLDAGVAGTSNNILLLFFLWLNKSSLRLRSRWLWCNGLRCAVNDLAILHETFNHPVIITTTENSIVNTALTEVEVTIITGAAVIMLIGDGLAAIVAVDREDVDRKRDRSTTVIADGTLTSF